jgi:hypothetical protein
MSFNNEMVRKMIQVNKILTKKALITFAIKAFKFYILRGNKFPDYTFSFSVFLAVELTPSVISGLYSERSRFLEKSIITGAAIKIEE